MKLYIQYALVALLAVAPLAAQDDATTKEATQQEESTQQPRSFLDRCYKYKYHIGAGALVVAACAVYAYYRIQRAHGLAEGFAKWIKQVELDANSGVTPPVVNAPTETPNPSTVPAVQPNGSENASVHNDDAGLSSAAQKSVENGVQTIKAFGQWLLKEAQEYNPLRKRSFEQN